MFTFLRQLLVRFVEIAYKRRVLISFCATIMIVSSIPAQGLSPKELTTPGGIKVWHALSQELPIVSVQFAFGGGSATDPVGKEGLTELLSALFDEGAGELNARNFQLALKDLSADIRFTAGQRTLYGSATMLSWNANKVASLLNLALTAPRFDIDAIERMRRQLVASARNRSQDPSSLANDKIFSLAYPGHAFGRSSHGTIETLSEIKRSDIVRRWQDLVHREDFQVVVVGDVSKASLPTFVDSMFNNVPGNGPSVDFAKQLPQPHNEISTISWDIPQSVIRFFLPGLTRDDPDFLTAYVLNHILGGGSFSSRLFQEIREKRGLAYSVWTSLSSSYQTGIILGGAGTRNRDASETIALIRQTLKELAASGPTEAELKQSIDFLTGNYALRFAGTENIGQQFLAYNMYDLGLDYMEKRNNLLRAITLDDLRRVARRLYNSIPTFVLVGRTGAPGADKPQSN